MENYTPTLSHDIPEPKRVVPKSAPEQRVKIDTLLKYRAAIKETKVALLEAMKSEGQEFVMVPAGEIEQLGKLIKENSPIKRIVSFRECDL